MCLNVLKPGDTLAVWRLDRLGRSMRHLVTLIEDLGESGIGYWRIYPTLGSARALRSFLLAEAQVILEPW